jgi:hypothetical protein
VNILGRAYDRIVSEDEVGVRLTIIGADPEVAGPRDEEGGDPVCWAHLVCEECGAITTEGHRDWCSRQAPGAR